MKFNNTTNFILPVLFQDRVFYNMHLTGDNPFEYMLKMGFQNAYLEDRQYSKENCLYLLFAPNRISKEYITFSEMVLEKHTEYLEDYDVNENTIMYVFKINEEYIPDVELIKEGKYSQTSQKYKALFPNKVKNKDGRVVLHANWMILHKHPQWKKTMEEKVGAEIPLENELWDAFHEEDEIYNYKT